MPSELISQLSPVLFIPHGGGPLPLLADKGHQKLIDFLKGISPALGRPSAILIISAHWEADKTTITSGITPSLIYDYSGFPDEAYEIEYPVPGEPNLAKKVYNLLQDGGIDSRMDDQRGFDHGLYVPLKIMFPDGTIPCVQLSLDNTLDPKVHIKMGNALKDLRKNNVLIIGSGFSFHNIKAFFSRSADVPDTKNEAFEHWLIETCTSDALSSNERETRLIDWDNAPFARYCHPREEHLLPLHVCFGMSNSAAELVFSDKVMGKMASAFRW